MVIKSSGHSVFNNIYLFRYIYSYIPGCSTRKWTNGTLAIKLGYYKLFQLRGVKMNFCNGTQFAAMSNHKNNFDIFKWVVINIGIKQNTHKDWINTIDTLTLTNKKTMLRWLIMMSEPNKLNIQLYWYPDITYEKVIEYKHYDIIKWMSVHHKGIQTENVTIEPLSNDCLTSGYINLLSICDNKAFLIFIFEKIKDSISLSDIMKRCIKKNKIEIAHYICKDWSIDKRVDFLYNSTLCKHCNGFDFTYRLLYDNKKVHTYLMIEDYMEKTNIVI